MIFKKDRILDTTGAVGRYLFAGDAVRCVAVEAEGAELGVRGTRVIADAHLSEPGESEHPVVQRHHRLRRRRRRVRRCVVIGEQAPEWTCQPRTQHVQQKLTEEPVAPTPWGTGGTCLPRLHMAGHGRHRE